MKKSLYFLAAFLAFAVGIFGIYFRPFFVAVPVNEVEGKLKLYKNLKIKVKGNLSPQRFPAPDEDFMYFFRGFENSGVDFLDKAYLVIPKDIEKKERVWIEEVAEKNWQYKGSKLSVKGEYSVEVELSGVVKEDTDGIFKNTLVIEVEEIRQVSPIKFLSEE